MFANKNVSKSVHNPTAGVWIIRVLVFLYVYKCMQGVNKNPCAKKHKQKNGNFILGCQKQQILENC